MFCRECGKQLADNAAFCSGCGIKMKPSSGGKGAFETKTPSVDEAAVKTTSVDMVSKSDPAADAASAAVPVPGSEDRKIGEESRQESTPMQEKALEQESTPMQEKALEQESALRQEKSPKKKGGKAGIIVAFILLILGCAGGTVWYFTSPGFVSAQKMKKAQELMAQEEYKDALQCYQEALEKDETLLDAYLQSADLYVIQEKQESAIKLLQKAQKKLKENPEAVLLVDEKICQIYCSQIDGLLAKGDFEQAKQIAAQAVGEVPGNRELSTKRVSVYEKQAEQMIQDKTYDVALLFLEEANAVLGEDSGILSKRSDVYLAWSHDYLAKKEYDSAISLLEEGFEDTKDQALRVQEASVYLQRGEEALKDGDVEKAAEIWGIGADATGEKSLRDRIEEVAAHVTWDTKLTFSDGELNLKEVFDQQGNLLQEFIYYGDDNIFQQSDFDSQGRLLSLYRYDYDGNLQAAEGYEYNDRGLQTKWTSATYEYGWWGNTVTEINSTLYMYNEQDQLLGIYHYSSEQNDQIDTFEEFVYDEKGNLVVHWYYDGDGTSNHRVEMVYDDAGHTTEVHTLYYNTLYRKVLLTYNDAGLLTSEITYDQDGQEFIRNIYQYDEQGNVVFSEQTTIEDRWVNRNTTETGYDLSGHKISEKEAFDFYDDYGELSGDGYCYERTYEYDAQGNLVKVVQTYEAYGEYEYYDNLSDNHTIEYIYDGENRVIEENFNFGERITKTTYDSKGNRTHCISTDKYGDVQYEERMEYDAFGNVSSDYYFEKDYYMLHATYSYNYQYNK